MIESLWQDARHAGRVVARSPGIFLLAATALALGIGANTAVFSVLKAVLLQPLAYADPDRIVMVVDVQSDCDTCPASLPKYVDWREQNRVFESIGGAFGGSAVLTGAGDPERVDVSHATASLFDVLGVPAALGRVYTEAEDQPGAEPVVVLGHGFWQRRFGGDPQVLGRVITLDDVPRSVVGVMPEGFDHRRAEAWIPLARSVDEATRNWHFLATYARLAPGVSLEQARTEMRSLGERLAAEKPNMGHGVDVLDYRERIVGNARAPILLLSVSVVFVLLIACANVANLLLARGAARRREIALRSALGATRRRLARQLLTESVLLSASGAVLGVGLAWAGVRAFVAMAPPVLPRMDEIAVDPGVLLFTAVVAVAAGLLFGLPPVLHVRASGDGEALKQESGRSAGGVLGRRVGSALVVGEVALSVVLLMGAALLTKSLVRLSNQDLGLVAEQVLAFDVVLPEARYATDEATRGYFRQALERLGATPGVEAVGGVDLLPLQDFGSNGYFDVEGEPLWEHDRGPLAEMRVVAGDYFEAMGVPLLRGRLFTASDDADAPPVIVVNQALAERCWPGQDPIGRYLVFDEGDRRRVVGVVGDVRSYGPHLEPEMEISRPLAQEARHKLTLALRTRTRDATALSASIRSEMARLDADQPLSSILTMEQVVSESLARPRLVALLSTGFAGVAALLALVGVYGLIAYAVSQQRREMGIRIAVGASRGDVLRLVLGRGLALAVAGVVAGGLGALALARLLGSLLYQVDPADPAILTATAAAVLVAALLACWLPARTAARIDPAVTLRAT